MKKVVYGAVILLVFLMVIIGLAYTFEGKRWNQETWNHAWQEGYEAGFDDGYYEGYNDGHEMGENGIA